MVFSWLRYLGVEELVMHIREALPIYANNIPNWIIFSLPAGLWTYSLTYSMLWVWNGSHSKQKYFWVSLGLMLSIGSELGQYLHVVPGVFDLKDVLLGSILAMLALLCFKKEVVKGCMSRPLEGY